MKEISKEERKELLDNAPEELKDLIEIGIYTEDEAIEHLKREKCWDCFHRFACESWIRHGEILYDDFDYSVDGCPYHITKEEVTEIIYGEWEIYTDEYDCEYMRCSICGEEFYPVDEDTVDTTPNYCQSCGAKMDKD